VEPVLQHLFRQIQHAADGHDPADNCQYVQHRCVRVLRALGTEG
jgi:hypothetical protein